MGSMGAFFVVPRMTLVASFCSLSSFSRLDYDRIVRPGPKSMKLNITLWYSRNRRRCSMPFEAMAFYSNGPFLHLSFVDSTCVFYVSIPSKWIPCCLRLFVRSMTSPLKETADIACPTALLLRVHHRTCELFGLIWDSVSWHQCDTFSSCSWTAVTAVRMSLAFLYI